MDEVLEHADVKDKWLMCQDKDAEDATAGAATTAVVEDAANQSLSLVQGPNGLAMPLVNKIMKTAVALSESDETLVHEAERQVTEKLQSLLTTVNFATPPGRGETSESISQAHGIWYIHLLLVISFWPAQVEAKALIYITGAWSNL